MKKKYKTGIALGGGGTRGFAHLGVLQALYEKDIVPDILAGTSVGSIIGVLIASGKKPREVHNLMKDKKFTDFTSIQIPGNGMFALDGLSEKIMNEISVANLEDLNIPSFVTVSNLNKGAVEYHHTGPITTLVMASSSIPILFSPVEYNGYQYVDGGLFDNVPTEPLIDKCENLIAVNVNPVHEVKSLHSLKEVATRTFLLNVNATISETDRKCDIFIEIPGIDKYEILDASHADDLFQIGYDYVNGMKISFRDQET